MSKGRILVADDEVILAETLQSILTGFGYDLQICTEGEKFFRMLADVNPDLVLLDIFMGKTNGLQLLHRMKAECFDTPVLIMTGHADVALAVEAIRRGAVDFVIKPFDLSHLSVLIERAMEQSRLRRKVQLSQHELEVRRFAVSLPLAAEQLSESYIQ